MAGRAEVDAKRKELLSLKQSVSETYAEYQRQADVRISRQKEMAQLVQLVQTTCQSTDVPLVEDVILASLWAETKALRSKRPVPDKPIIDPANQPTGSMTKSAEEAIAVYCSQIDLLRQDQSYRQAMLDNEVSMADEFGEGLLQIERIVVDHCNDEGLRDQVIGIVQKGGNF